jgi:hypothetical protein
MVPATDLSLAVLELLMPLANGASLRSPLSTFPLVVDRFVASN